MSAAPLNCCEGCRRPIPPELSSLPALVLDQLDRHGSISAEQTARRLNRRTADVRAAYHLLEDAGLVRLEQPTASPRSRRWAAISHENGKGRAWDAHHAAAEPVADSTSALALVGLLAALVASPRPLSVRLALGVCVGLTLVALGSLIRSSEGSS